MLKRTQLSHNSTFKPRPSPMRRASLSRSREGGKQAVAYRANPEDGWCAACGRSGDLDHSHILTQHQHPKHRCNPLNWLMLCRFPCHDMWEHNKARFKATYPEAFAEKMRRMKLLDAQAFAFFCMKFPRLT